MATKKTASKTASRKPNIRQHSSLVVDGTDRAPSRSMLRAVGFDDADFKKPQVGIASTWSMVTPCNMHIDQLALKAAEGANMANGKAVVFNTITISDGISMGTEGMKYSLVSREVIADSIEAVTGCQGFDALVTIGGCDKNMPGCMIGMARLNRPSVFVYGGTIMPGCHKNKPTDVVSVFEAVGAEAQHKISKKELKEIECTAIPGPGSCGGMYTANTMASAIEAMGMSLPNSSAQAAISKDKTQDCVEAGRAAMYLLRNNIRPSDIMTRKAFENAITVVIALGGSTNAVLHLLAMASAIGVKLKLDDFTRIGKRVPVLADLRPSGKAMMSELIEIGGIQPLMKMLLDAGLLHGDCLTVTGKTLKQNLAKVQPSRHPARQSCPGRLGGQDFGQGRPAFHRQGAGFLLRGAGPEKDPRQHRQEGRRHRGALRGPEGRPRHARDAVADFGHHGQGTRQGCRLPDRRPLFRRLARFRGRPRHPRGGGRRPDRAAQKR
jgi:dihydroxy-acid dehydratase